jgi:hypothetical protein
MASARIYKPSKSAMQSGTGRSKDWLLVFEPEAPRQIDPLMGWTSATDTRQQVVLSFDTAEEAVAYARRNGIPYRLEQPKVRKPVKKSYSDNFKWGRLVPWTH